MTSELDFDPALFGLWPKAAVYDGLGADASAALEETARRVILETKAKSVSPLDDLQDMLNGMTRELREQMQQFQRLRPAADQKAAASEDEIDRKLIQADAKASIEAMSTIVRTLEKIDSLQRTIAHDRQMLAEQDTDEVEYAKLVALFDSRVEMRAADLVRRRDAQALRDAPDKAADDDPHAAGATGRGNMDKPP